MLMFSSKDEENIETQEKYGFLFEDLDNKTQYQMMYQAVFMIRRAIFCAVLICLTNLPIMQITIHILATLIYMIYIIQVKPFKEKKANQQEIFNEYCNLLASYC